MEKKVAILGFGGSLRKGSFNKALLMAAQELVPDDARLEIFDIRDIPVFNQDFESDLPQIVREFKVKINAADALLIVTPEYNHSIPGFLKNAIDFASRPGRDNSFSGKPVAIMGASDGAMGTVRAQNHLRQVFATLNMHVLNRPEVLVASVQDKIDEHGTITDQATTERIKKLLLALVAWTAKLKKN